MLKCRYNKYTKRPICVTTQCNTNITLTMLYAHIHMYIVLTPLTDLSLSIRSCTCTSCRIARCAAACSSDWAGAESSPFLGFGGLTWLSPSWLTHITTIEPHWDSSFYSFHFVAGGQFWHMKRPTHTFVYIRYEYIWCIAMGLHLKWTPIVEYT